MAIRYKVVNRGRRSCFVDFRPFSLYYPKGKTVHPPRGTKIFVFKTRRDAEQFISLHKDKRSDRWKILRVEGIGRGKSMKFTPTSFYEGAITCFWRNFTPVFRFQKNKAKVSCYGDSILFHSHNQEDFGSSICLSNRNEGTMLYDAVRVID